MIIEMTTGAVDQSATYASDFWSSIMGDSEIVATPTTDAISGTGSFANISGTGSDGVISGAASNSGAITGRGGV